ncbi:putative tricarboxylic transport membrane protein [Salibacterium salarium]|uniref:tripartite tricarboxylate transporter permease n=1 Tax=Salibacterium salarium TaxID=284579 RepID=UPI0027876DDF|nr:tripartite tricarboxylate transporter permease [Salibacterium salarium]MDQ0300744.1 putative tricarboxylic transport membrane protein [Salibacterium salarium]
MGSLEGIFSGVQLAFSFQGILFVFLGVMAGTLIGMMPGLGPISAIAIMIPLTYNMDPPIALVLMAGVYYGAVFGGSTSSILLNAPGISGTVATSFDGYPMAQRGEAGKALAIAAISSFVGGTISVILLMLFAPMLSSIAIVFGPPEYFALMVLGLTAISSLADGSTIKALISAVVGMMAVTIGIDTQTGTTRFTFGNPNLLEGIDFLVVALGLFALAEVCALIINRKQTTGKNDSIGSLKLSKSDFKDMSGPMGRQSFLGFILGILPGAGATIASFIGYITEKKITKKPEEFGKGAVRGVSAPETANNAATSGAFVPLLSLGIPGSGTTAVLLGALLVMDIQPGPLLMTDQPELFWGVIVSMYIGNMFLLILNLPLIPYIAKILSIPRPMLVSLVIMFSMIGVYSISFNVFDLYLLLIFGALGYIMRLLKFPPAPFILAFILGGMMEESFRQAMTMSNNDITIFFTQPIALGMLIVGFLSFIVPILQSLRQKNKNAVE